MASDLYQSIGGDFQAQSQPQSQDPKAEVLRRMQQMGFNTEGKENDPQALMQMVLQSGPVFQNRLPMAQNYLMRFMGRR